MFFHANNYTPNFFKIHVLISQRWVWEFKIHFYGSHHLLPATMPLSRNDAQFFGAIPSRANESRCSAVFLQNTAHILTMLGYESVPKSPTYLVASKTIVNPQLYRGSQQ